jgi:FtsP/CotA-like multicopper oxidase with cupredoxin domain
MHVWHHDLARHIAASALLFSSLQACGGEAVAPHADAVQTRAIDTHADLKIVEVYLIAERAKVAFRDGTATEVWAYRDAAGSRPASVPGPLIEAKLGDRLIVHFDNALDIGTTIHHHGPRLPNAMDGLPDGAMVLPGKSFTYDFVLKDAGTFWYHPHWQSDVQLYRGLKGQLIARDPLLDAALADAHERVLMLHDVELDDAAELVLDTPNQARVGRIGSTLLVNGAPTPTLDVIAGRRERWRLTNASNGRVFDLELAGHDFTVIASDLGRIAPYATRRLRLAPADRLEVLIVPSGARLERLPLVTHPVDRGFAITPAVNETVLTLAIRDRIAPAADIELPAPAALPYADTAAAVQRSLSLEYDPSPPAGEAPAYRINGKRWPFAEPLPGARGLLERWQVSNATPTPEPLHVHGTRMQLVAIDGVAQRLSLEDTIEIPAGASAEILLRFDEPGHWMFHSHLLEHAERGMMGAIHVP